MTIQQAFLPYMDGNGLMTPNPVTQSVLQGSDNGPLYSSEYIIILKKNGQLQLSDIAWYGLVIGKCVDSNGNLHRSPQDSTEDAPDDYYGVFAAYNIIGLSANISLPFNLWRQPQLLYASICANKNAAWWKFWQWPLAFYSALVILTSDINTDPGNTDARLLAWLLIQATSNHSILVRLASHVWYNRLFATYGATGMQAVAGIYFQPQDNNPYQTYWVTK